MHNLDDEIAQNLFGRIVSLMARSGYTPEMIDFIIGSNPNSRSNRDIVDEIEQDLKDRE